MNDWIIGVCSSGANGVHMSRFYGTKEEVKRKLSEMVLTDKKEDEVNWEYGTEFVEDVEELGTNEMYAYGCYSDYHIDYTAKLFVCIEHS